MGTPTLQEGSDVQSDVWLRDVRPYVCGLMNKNN